MQIREKFGKKDEYKETVIGGRKKGECRREKRQETSQD